MASSLLHDDIVSGRVPWANSSGMAIQNYSPSRVKMGSKSIKEESGKRLQRRQGSQIVNEPATPSTICPVSCTQQHPIALPYGIAS